MESTQGPLQVFAATSNPGKLRDFAAASEAFGVSIQTLPNLSDVPAPAETEDSFEGNARLKAVFYSRHAPGEWVLADDSGLEVDALEGRPGVRSARFAEDLGALDIAAGVNVSNNDALLLAMLEQVDRRARYHCVLALARDGTVLHVASGSVEGEILSEPEGTGGFGYDPLFFVAELGKSMAQAAPKDRMLVSHRARALQALLRQLATENPREAR